MKAKDLAEKLLENPDFDVDFLFMEFYAHDETCVGQRIDKYKDVTICDIGYSDKVIILTGDPC